MGQWRGGGGLWRPRHLAFLQKERGPDWKTYPPRYVHLWDGAKAEDLTPALSIYGEGANAIWQLFEADGEDLEAEGAAIDADAGLGGGLGACGVAQVDDAATGLEGDLDA